MNFPDLISILSYDPETSRSFRKSVEQRSISWPLTLWASMLEGSSEDSKTNRAGDSGWQPSCPSRTSQYRDSFGTDLSDPPKEQTKSPRTSWALSNALGQYS